MNTTTDVTVLASKSYAARWKHEKLFKQGYLAVPVSFLQHYARLKNYGGLTHAEAMFVLQVMAFKWDARAPYPSYALLAKRLGTSIKTVQRQAQALERKGYIQRETRTGRSNAFEFSALFDALLEAVEKESQTLFPEAA